MSRETISAQVADYYGRRLAEHGATPQGVDWNSAESQELRFEQFLPLFRGDRTGRVLDYGCGYGAFADFLARRHTGLRYIGYDLSDAMVSAARSIARPGLQATFTSDHSLLEPVEWCVASGIFNVKLDTPSDQWREYVLETIGDLRALTTRGFAFNILTSYSDADRRKESLYYAEPGELFDFCKRNISRQVALLHDYGLWEFTMFVRFDGS